MLQQLLTRLINADLRVLWIVWSPVDLQHIFHRRNEFGVMFRRNAEPDRSPGFRKSSPCPVLR